MNTDATSKYLITNYASEYTVYVTAVGMHEMKVKEIHDVTTSDHPNHQVDYTSGKLGGGVHSF